MNVPALTMSIWLGFATVAAAQGTPSGKPASPSASKTQLSEVRSLVHDLQGRTEKLRDLMTQYRSLVEQRPQSEGGSPEAKKAQDEQLAKWSGALERLLRRVDTARAAVAETLERLGQAATGTLPTALGKDVANARNEAEAQRAGAEQALVKSKPTLAKGKRTPQAPAPDKAPPPPSDDLADLEAD
jgi:hypothetical protein